MNRATERFRDAAEMADTSVTQSAQTNATAATANVKKRTKLGACLVSLLMVLAMVPLAACSSSGQSAAEEQFTVSYDQGDVDSAYGVQNWDAVQSATYEVGDIVQIPDYGDADYGVFVPGYWLSGWKRSDNGVVIPVSSDSSAFGGSSESSGSGDEGSSSEEGVAGVFSMPEQDVTLTAQWEPYTVDVYVQNAGEETAENLGSFELHDADLQGGTDNTDSWQTYNTFNSGEARVYTAAFWYPLETIFEKAGVAVDPQDTVTIGQSFVSEVNPPENSSISHTWEYYTTGQFYPNTTCDTYDSNNAEAVTPALALSYDEGRSSSKSELLGKIAQANIDAGIGSQSAAMTPRSLFGVPQSEYDKNDNYKGSEHPYYVNQILITKAAA